jgi:hypothetical protein
MRHLIHSAVLAICLVAAPAIAADGDYQDFKKKHEAGRRRCIQQLFDKHAPAVVTLKFVATQEFFGQESKSQVEAVGILVSTDGLVVVANSSLNPFGSIPIMGGPPGMDMPKPKHKNSDYRIIIGDETEEFEAHLVARDSERDLAWFRMTDAKGRSFPYVRLGDSTELQVGDAYYTISRMADRFNRAPVLSGGNVGGRITSPRTLLVATGGSGAVFTENGKFTGLLIRQPDEDGAGGSMGQMPSQFILPAKELAKATQQVRKQSSK